MEARLSYIYLLTECLLIESSMCRKENDGKRARMATTFRSVIGNIILGELIPMMMTDHMRHKISTLSKFWERERLMDDSVLSSIRVELASCEDDYIISLQPETEARKSRRASRMATFLDNVLVQKNEKIHHQIHKKFPTGESRVGSGRMFTLQYMVCPFIFRRTLVFPGDCYRFLRVFNPFCCRI